MSGLAFSDDGRLLAAGSWDRSIYFVDPGTGQVVQTFQSSTLVSWVAFSPEGAATRGHPQSGSTRGWARRLASGGADGTVTLWDPATGREVLTLRGLKLDTIVSFSRDGRKLAATGLRGSAMLWEAASPEEVAARDARERAGSVPPQ